MNAAGPGEYGAAAQQQVVGRAARLDLDAPARSDGPLRNRYSTEVVFI
jgi:hypothetical protein